MEKLLELGNLRQAMEIESKKIIDVAKSDYESKKETYNDKALSDYKSKLLGDTRASLSDIKAKYINKAEILLEEAQSQYNKRLEPKQLNTQEAILKELQELNRYNKWEIEYSTKNTQELIHILDNEDVSEMEFNFVKGLAMNNATEDTKKDIILKKYVDTEQLKLDTAKKELALLGMQTDKYIVPFTMNQNVEYLVTGEDPSNYYFSK